MRVMVAMSGGVDSSVAAAILHGDGHHVVGATMKLWGGSSDTGCCSVADVDDARRVAQQLGVDHHVFNFTDDFDRHVVEPYVADHAAGITPNPCIECNRHLKFDRFLRRAEVLGFDAVATGHHARVTHDGQGRPSLRRGADPAKDQSYVLHMLRAGDLPRVLFPIGSMSKVEVRARAAQLGLRTADKPDSQDVCFISRRGGRAEFLGSRIALHPGRVLDESGRELDRVAAVELVTVGQRKGLGPSVGDRYAVEVDPAAGMIRVAPAGQLLVTEIALTGLSWVDSEPDRGELLEVQMSAHGAPVPARWDPDRGVVATEEAVRRVSPGQSVVLYRGDAVVGGGAAVAPARASGDRTS